jgi:nucleoside-diphosphate-sugar epimerase
MGHLLVPALRERGYDVVALDLVPLCDETRSQCLETVQGSILEFDKVEKVLEKHQPEMVFHLAAVLSSKADLEPDLAHEVNVQGTIGLMRLCRESASETGRDVRFLYPSSIAAYGMPDSGTKEEAGAITEGEFNQPSGVYGCNKIYGELMGSFFTAQAKAAGEPGLDFRAIRFPGLISAETVPSGGTSDYGPEMIHAAARGERYACFVRPDSRLPFMTMPDAVEGFLDLAEADADSLSTRVYNIRAFSPSAEDFRAAILEHFPEAEISFEPVPHRQTIVDSWPADVDDSLARADWNFNPRFGFGEAIRDYLLPSLLTRYGSTTG